MNQDRLREESIKKTLEKLGSIENQINNPMYDLQKEETFKVHIHTDKSVAHGMFKPHPTLNGHWLASSQTYRAMKKDIFAMTEDMLDLHDEYNCSSCKSDLDKQFWHFCPYCGSQFDA